MLLASSKYKYVIFADIQQVTSFNEERTLTTLEQHVMVRYMRFSFADGKKDGKYATQK